MTDFSGIDNTIQQLTKDVYDMKLDIRKILERSK
jgi:hypothetical protein